jgi:hypothetical protein
MSHSRHGTSKSSSGGPELQSTIQERIAFIKRLSEGSKFEGLLMSEEDKSHIVHHDHKEGVACKDVKCILRKKVRSFTGVLSEIGGTIEYIKSGATGHTLKGVAPSGFCYAIKVVAFPRKAHYSHPNNIERPENAELLMIKLLSKLVTERKTPHIILPIGTFNTDLAQVVAITRKEIKDCKRYKKFLKLFDKKHFHPQASVLLSEWANKGDLLDYFRNNYRTMTLMDWKTIFFQVLQCFAAIQQDYPKFRHNDAKANNILVREIPKNPMRPFHTFRGVGKYNYLVPNIGLQTGLWDFDFASIPGKVDNVKVQGKGTDYINVTTKQHRYYDIHYFFNTLGTKAFFPALYLSSKIPEEVLDFIERVIPEKYMDNPKYVGEGGRLMVDDEYWLPVKLLEKDEFFEEFRYTDKKLKKTLLKLERERDGLHLKKKDKHKRRKHRSSHHKTRSSSSENEEDEQSDSASSNSSDESESDSDASFEETEDTKDMAQNATTHKKVHPKKHSISLSSLSPLSSSNSSEESPLSSEVKKIGKTAQPVPSSGKGEKLQTDQRAIATASHKFPSSSELESKPRRRARTVSSTGSTYSISSASSFSSATTNSSSSEKNEANKKGSNNANVIQKSLVQKPKFAAFQK